MSFELQNQIKKNMQEMRQATLNLYEWEQEMQLKEKAKKKIQKQQSAQLKEQTSKIVEAPKLPEQKQQTLPVFPPKNQLVRDANTVSDYYNAWSKVDLDKELERLEEEERKAYKPYNPYEDSKNIVRAKPKTKINITGKRANVVVDPTELKDKGNLYFQSCEFAKALECYTQCIEKLSTDQLTPEISKLLSIVFSNRAMTHLKLNDPLKSLSDCDSSLSYDKNNVKSMFRKGECLKKLGKYNQALSMFKKVLTLQKDPKSQTEIKKIQAFLEKRYQQARENMVVTYKEQMMRQSQRIEIQEVQSIASELQIAKESQQSPNYLQQL